MRKNEETTKNKGEGELPDSPDSRLKHRMKRLFNL